MNSGKVALIAGASSGIGAAFARTLAGNGYDLILVARREDRLKALAADIRERHRVAVEVLVADLSNLNDVKVVEARISGLEALDLLINCAGFGTSGNFAEIDLEKQMDMVHVHVIATVRFCRAALPQMIARHRGAIINVSSVSAFLPLPGNATYSASKAYLVTFSKALQAELAGTGVSVQALCPGFTYTGFHDTAEFAQFDRRQVPASLWMTADELVTLSLDALARGKTVYVPGWKNRLMVSGTGRKLISLVPRRWIRKVLRRK
jgi:short-subunit dehydrogenase